MTQNKTSNKGFALITGASWGIGSEFARQLARDGYDLVLTARTLDRMQALQMELASFGRTIHVVAADLGSREEIGKLQKRVQALNVEIELLINNAAFGSGGAFHKQELTRQLSMVDVNVRAVVELTHLFLPDMRQRGHGGIINVASVAGFLPLPLMPTYAATKAFVLSFSQALYCENREKGVHVMASCPGPTDTNFFVAANMAPLGRKRQTAEEVVRESMRAFYKKRPVVVTGMSNKAIVAALRFAPRSLMLSGATSTTKRRNT